MKKKLKGFYIFLIICILVAKSKDCRKNIDLNVNNLKKQINTIWENLYEYDNFLFSNIENSKLLKFYTNFSITNSILLQIKKKEK